jgi:hypothetical protein
MQDSVKLLNRVKAMRKTFKSIIISTMAAGGMAFASAANAGSTYGSLGYSSGHGGYSYGVGYASGHRGYGGHRRYRGHRRHRGHGAANALLGFGLGMMLFSAINQPRRGSGSSYDRDYRRYDNYNGGDYGYDRRPAEPYRYEPAPARSNVVNPLASAQDSSCLQTREYQMTVIIGGEEKDAYGTACLQPDGSWLQGPPTVVPDFD